jgi:hypothetical protein
MVRNGDSLTEFCLKSEGTTVWVGPDVPDNSTEKRYGLPGSGYPRCSSKDEVPGGFFLRLWANRELGPSLVLGLISETGPTYYVLINRQANWIIIEDQKNGPSCYFSRGQKVITTEDNSATGKWPN